MNNNKRAFNLNCPLPAPVPLRSSPLPDAFSAFALRFSPASVTDEVEHRIDDLHLCDNIFSPSKHPPIPEKDAKQEASIEEQSYWLEVPEDEMQRVQSPPVSPVPPDWADEMVEGGPDATDPFPLPHLDQSCILTPRGGRKASDSEFVVVRLKERQQGQVPITVDMYHDALSTSPVPFYINKMLLH